MIRSQTCICGSKMHVEMNKNTDGEDYEEKLDRKFGLWMQNHRCIIDVNVEARQQYDYILNNPGRYGDDPQEALPEEETEEA